MDAPPRDGAERIKPFLAVTARPRLTVAALMAVDVLAVAGSIAAALAMRIWADGRVNTEVYSSIWAAPIAFVLAFAAMGLYPAVAMSPAEELRRTTVTSTLVFLVMSAAVFLAKEANAFSRGAFVIAWLLTLAAVPTGRGALRALVARRRWWGYSAVVLGGGAAAAGVVERLQRFPRLGLKPVAVLDPDATDADEGAIAGIPVVGRVGLAPILDDDLRVPFAIVAMPGAPPERLLAVIDRFGKIFAHLIVIPDLFGATSMWMSGRDLGGMLGLEVKQRLLLPGPRRRKRVVDLVLAIGIALAAAPVIAAIALLVRLDSRGPAFYAHDRIGQGGRRFRAWKFRSMVRDADAVLARYLDAHPELREEWERDHKLKDDPRVTRLGGLLRRTSLDELPQLWNVLRGEMSLVGPRPIVQAEVQRYTGSFHLYGKLKPGMTGLWQVSGRNDTTYDQRVAFDAYYARNWSVWLDLHILARTFVVVVVGRGAY